MARVDLRHVRKVALLLLAVLGLPTTVVMLLSMRHVAWLVVDGQNWHLFVLTGARHTQKSLLLTASSQERVETVTSWHDVVGCRVHACMSFLHNAADIISMRYPCMTRHECMSSVVSAVPLQQY
jgi:hypothetical protein